MIFLKDSACFEQFGERTDMVVSSEKRHNFYDLYLNRYNQRISSLPYISSGIVEKTGPFFQQVLTEKDIKISVKNMFRKDLANSSHA